MAQKSVTEKTVRPPRPWWTTKTSGTSLGTPLDIQSLTAMVDQRLKEAQEYAEGMTKYCAQQQEVMDNIISDTEAAKEQRNYWERVAEELKVLEP